MKMKTAALAMISLIITIVGVLQSSEYGNTQIVKIHMPEKADFKESTLHKIVVGPLGDATIKKLVHRGKETIILPAADCDAQESSDVQCS